MTLARTMAALGLTIVAWVLRGRLFRREEMHESIVRLAVRYPWPLLLAMMTGALAVAAIVVISGIMPIKASSGHWRLTAALLDFAKTRSVAMHSWGLETPILDDQALILRGAAHYENACLPCHGAPGRSIPPVSRAMTPPPPELRERLIRWSPEELFSIVRHGIKFTGMPAWPSPRRDDEVWAVVAFLRRLPQTDAAGYRQLSRGDSPVPTAIDESQPPETVQDACRYCHGVDGAGRGAGAFPALAGQRAEYLYASLRAFADRRRFSAIMLTVAANLSDATMREAASYYSRLPPRKVDGPSDTKSIARGETIAIRGVPDRDVPACVECHGPTALPKNAAYPRLAGQHPRYLVDQLRLLQARHRGGTPNVNLMHVFVDRLRSRDIDDVAHYYGASAGESQPP